MSRVGLGSWKGSPSCPCDQIGSCFTSRNLLRRRASLTFDSSHNWLFAIGRRLLQMLWTTWGQNHRPSPPAPSPARQFCIACPRAQVQSKLHHPELRHLGACGKERTGFPQVGGADLFEIPHPICPELWKRCCYVMRAVVGTVGECVGRDFYWIGSAVPGLFASWPGL